MGIFKHVSKNKSTNIHSGTVSFDVIFSDYVRNDDLNNYYRKSEPIDVGGNIITFYVNQQKLLMQLIEIFFIEDLLQLLQI